jgi:hypothetical protein
MSLTMIYRDDKNIPLHYEQNLDTRFNLLTILQNMNA